MTTPPHSKTVLHTNPHSTNVSCETDDIGALNAFVQGGNAFKASAVLGTQDTFPLVSKIGGVPVMAFEPDVTSPNIYGGSWANSIGVGTWGATIAGGGRSGGDCGIASISPCWHRVTGTFGTVSGGMANSSLDVYSTVAGRSGNSASNPGASVGGGTYNVASGISSAIGGGSENAASGNYSAVPGGFQNSAQETNSFAAGYRAHGVANGSFAWPDYAPGYYWYATGTNAFVVRATGGVQFTVQTDVSGFPTKSCVFRPIDSGWVCASDRGVKERFAAADTTDVLRRLVAMPLFQWSPKGTSGDIGHLGPTAQDIRAAFALGEGDTAIDAGDASGVALAAIQGLHQVVQDKDREIAGQKREITALKRDVAQLKSLMKALAAKSR